MALKMEGRVQLEALEGVPGELTLTAYAFDARGNLVGEEKVGRDGSFAIPLKLKDKQDVELIVSPAADIKTVRASATYSQWFSDKDWVGERPNFLLRPDLYVLRHLWWPWWPAKICVSGHVSKVSSDNGTVSTCPVPYVKVEIFDVDRESCWWPYLVRWWDKLLDRPVVRIPDLMRERPQPPKVFPTPPLPEPVGPVRQPLAARLSPRQAAALGPQPEPPDAWGWRAISPQPEPPYARGWRAINPQPEPPGRMLQRLTWQTYQAQPLQTLEPAGKPAFTQVGEINELAPEIAARLDKLTLSSKLPPWLIFRRYFYSKALVCQTYTDCDGFFKCCFKWWPFHFRKGRLRFDSRPDIIIKVTQVINGVEQVIYLDPYTSTRWNVTNAHIELYLDDEQVVCGPGCGPDPDLPDSQASILRIGADPVWNINQADGKYTVPPINNGAYRGNLYVFGEFGPNLKTGSPPKFYRLSYAKAASSGGVPPDGDFNAIKTPLDVLRAAPLGTFETYNLGPRSVGTTQYLYEVQDIGHWWMFNFALPSPTTAGGMLIGLWDTPAFEADQGTYWLRLEVFDENGNKMPAVQFANHGGNGTVEDPEPVSTVEDHLDLKVHIDNKPVTYDLTTPATNECGVIKWSETLTLNFHVHAEQENGRVHSWDLYYVKGTNPTRIYLGDGTFNSGQSPVDVDVNGAALLSEPVTASNPTGQLQSTCAFALLLRAWAHVRNNWGFTYFGEKAYAIAIEKCPPCPEKAKNAALPT